MGVAPPTEVSTAISFLYRHFVPGCYYWELFELLRRFLLVGVAVVIQPGSVAQLTFATLFSMMFSVFEHQLRPYKSPYDNFLAISASFTLSILFFTCVLLKLGILVGSRTCSASIFKDARSFSSTRACSSSSSLQV